MCLGCRSNDQRAVVVEEHRGRHPRAAIDLYDVDASTGRDGGRSVRGAEVDRKNPAGLHRLRNRQEVVEGETFPPVSPELPPRARVRRNQPATDARRKRGIEQHLRLYGSGRLYATF